MAREQQVQSLCGSVDGAVLTRMQLVDDGQEPDSAAFKVMPKTSAVGKSLLSKSMVRGQCLGNFFWLLCGALLQVILSLL